MLVYKMTQNLRLLNLICNLEPKKHSFGIRLHFDYGVGVITSWLANEKRPESLSGKIDIDRELV